MSLFEDGQYQYRDTYFVFFEKRNQPGMDKIESCLAELGSRYEVVKRLEKDGEFESMTFVSAYDFSAMDIALIRGEEVQSQVKELLEEFKTVTLTGDEPKKLDQLKCCDSRFDIFHFERVNSGSEDEFIDPGGLLLLLEKLSDLCGGIALDPQSQSLM